MTQQQQNGKVEKFWIYDPVFFITDFSNAAKFIPDKFMTFEEQLNATLRFAIYFSIIVFVIRNDHRVLFFAIFIALFTVIIHQHHLSTKDLKKQVLEKLELKQDKNNGYCVESTPSNPFMNVSMEDYKTFPNRPKACNLQQRSVQRKVKQNFEEGLYRDVDDIFNKKASDRQYYTMPVTTIPNDQKAFANWLYSTNGKTCKERNESCKVVY